MHRKINEDHYVTDDVHRFYVVCDGMGGHAGGEVASRLGCDSIANFIRATRQGTNLPLPYPWDPNLLPESNRLSMAIRVANYTIYDAAARNSGLQGMGTTVAALLFHDGLAHVAHVGDSRVYRFRADKLEPLTRDHSEVNELIDAGRLSPEQARFHPEKNIITRALGIEMDVLPTVRVDRVKDDDLYLLCSDGVTDFVSERKLTELIRAALAPSEHRGSRINWLANEVVKMANRVAGKDNITVIVAHLSR
ncbi:MAG: protein phosphatase 2C domain-containing protein [Myxococcota bacterium]